MKILGNIIWIAFAGLWIAVLCCIIAAFFAITIVGMPFALQAIKIARFALWPMGYEVTKR